MVDPATGELFWVPPDQYERAVNVGMVAESPGERREKLMAEKYGDSEIAAAAMGAASGLSAGIAPQVLSRLAPNLNFDAVKQYNPTAYALGDVGGTVASSVSPGGLMNLVGRGGARMAGGMAAKSAGKGLLARAAAKTAGAATKGAIEGAAIGASMELGEQGYRRELSPDDIAKEALAGAAFGAASNLVAEAAMAPIKAASSALKGTGRLSDLRRAAKVADEEYTSLMAGGSDDMAEALSKKKAADIAKNKVYKTAGATKEAKAAAKAEADAASKEVQRLAKEKYGDAKIFQALKSKSTKASEAYLKARSQLGYQLAAKSTAPSLAVGAGAVVAGGAAGSAVMGGAGGAIGAAYTARNLAKMLTGDGKRALKKIFSPKVEATAAKDVAGWHGYLGNVRKKIDGATDSYGRATAKQLAGEWAADAAATAYEYLPGFVKRPGLARAAKVAGTMSRTGINAATISAMNGDGVGDLVSTIHDMDESDMGHLVSVMAAGGATPEQIESAKQREMSALELIRSEVRDPSAETESPLGTPPPLSVVEQSKARDLLKIKTDPEHFFELMADGRLNSNHVKMLSVVRPDMLAAAVEMMQSYAEAAKLNRVGIDRNVEKSLTLLLSGTYGSKYTGQIQLTYNKDEEQQQGQLKARNVQMDTANKMLSYSQRVRERA